MSSAGGRMKEYLAYALYVGLFVLVGGFFVSPGSSSHHTWIYLALYIPALAALVLYAPTLARDLRENRTLQCFTLLLAWLALSVLWTDFEDKPHLLKLLAMLWILVWAVRLMLNDMRAFSITLGLALAVGAVVALITAVNYFLVHGSDFYLTRLDHIGQRQVPAIVVGKLCTVCLMYCLMQERLLTKPWLRIAFGIMALLFLLPVVLSFSRTAILALGLTALWFSWQRGNIWAALFVTSTTVLLFVLMVLDNDNQWLTNISRSHTFEIRLWGWKATWQAITEHPWLGHGLHSAFVVDWRGTPYESSGMDFWHAHNLVLAVWYDAGAVGLVLLLTLVALVAKKLRPLVHIPEVRYWSYIFLFVFLASLVDSPALINRPAGDWLWFWLPVAIAINADKIVVRPARSYLQSAMTLPGGVHQLPDHQNDAAERGRNRGQR